MQVQSPQGICRFAIATGDITPPVGIYHRMWGAASHDRATGVHQPLRATVAVFAPQREAAEGGTMDDASAGKSTAGVASEDRRDYVGAFGDRCDDTQVLIALDHCIMGREEMDQLLSAVSEKSGLPRDSLLVVFSHTHAAGLMGLDRGGLPGGDLIAGYLESVHARLADLIELAMSQLAPATIACGTARCDLAAHRDLWDEAADAFVCGFDPDEPADDTLVVARVSDGSGRAIATLVNYACHPTTLAWENTQISPDYIGAMREVVEAATAAPCLFLQGASGELGPKEGFVGDVEVAERNGRQLGYAALSALTALPPPRTRFVYAGPVISGATLGVWKHEPLPRGELEHVSEWELRRFDVPLLYRSDLPTRAQVEEERGEWEDRESAARGNGDEEQAQEARAMVERKTRLLARVSSLPEGETYPLRVVLWRTGDVVWLGVQGEHYSLLQTALRKRFPKLALIVATIAYDWTAAYVPAADAYGKGIYQETVAVVAAGSLERLIDRLTDEIRRLR